MVFHLLLVVVVCLLSMDRRLMGGAGDRDRDGDGGGNTLQTITVYTEDELQAALNQASGSKHGWVIIIGVSG